MSLENFTIELKGKKEIVVQEKKTKTLKSLTILAMVDFPFEKKVIIRTSELGEVVLWEGKEYDNIGQWTNEDVEEKVKELFN